jgi:hypothetical protein
VSDSIIKEIQALQRMTVGQLRVEWERLYGEPTRSRNRTYLWRRLAWRIQEIEYGGLRDETRQRMFEAAPATFVRSQIPVGFQLQENGASAPPGAVAPRRDPRLPSPGSTIVREYRGQTLRLLVLADGFELDGVHHNSLSEAARVVTGQRWNGPLFWGLTKRTRKS